MRFVSDRLGGGVRYREFRVDGPNGEIPGGLWTPGADEPGAAGGPAREGDVRGTPLVLIGHGASGSKQQDYVRHLARHLVLAHSLSAAAIDGPVHGDRRQDSGNDGRLQFLDFVRVWSSEADLTDKMVGDWSAALDELLLLDEIRLPVGYWGLSMGTILGLPFVAADKRVSAAVLGLMGLTGPTRDRIATDAGSVTCAVLFLAQWSDQLFPIASALELFGAIGTDDKRLHANMGGHGPVPEDEFLGTADFLAKRLSSTG